MPVRKKELQRQKKCRRKGRRKKTSFLTRLVFWAPLLTFLLSAVMLGKIAYGYLSAQSEYAKIQKQVISVNTEKEEQEAEEDADSFAVDFEKLLSMNPDVIGWIRFPKEPSQISYPLLQGQDNEQYLHTTLNGSHNASGSIFLDAGNASDFTDFNSVIYGHRMKDGSMFRHLQDFEEQSFLEANSEFDLYLPDGRRLSYQVIAAGTVLTESALYRFTDEDSADYEAFRQAVSQLSICKSQLLSEDAHYVTLSTCTSASDEHRFVLIGRLETKE